MTVRVNVVVWCVMTSVVGNVTQIRNGGKEKRKLRKKMNGARFEQDQQQRLVC